MTEDKFRKMALALREASEAAHMGHPDFRVGGKIFATLGAKQGEGMVGLTLDQQRWLVNTAPDTFYPASGAWGARGATMVRLKGANESLVREALLTAWRNKAPKQLLKT